MALLKHREEGSGSPYSAGDVSPKDSLPRSITLIVWSQVVELTREGVEFLEQRFAQYDKDGDGRLSPSEQDDMFACAPSR